MTASFINTLIGNSPPPIPEVGLGATELLYSDRHAYTIVRISKGGKRFWMQRDIARRSDNNGMSNAQTYTYRPNPDAPEVAVSLRKDGKWRRVGFREEGVVSVGLRMEYYDYSF